MNKLLLIIKREYLAKVRNKSFVIMTILSPILIVGMIVLIAYLTKVNDSDKRIVTVLNESLFFHGDFLTNNQTAYINFESLDLDEAKDSTLNLGYYGLLYIPGGPDLQSVAEQSYFYTKEAPNTLVLDQLESVFSERIRAKKLEELGVTDREYREIGSGFDLRTSTFEGEENLKGINEIKALIGGGFGYLIMMFIVIYGGFVMRSVIEEKTSRIIEIIISAVKPFHLMLGKIIGTSLAGVTQFAIWIVSASVLMVVVLSVFGIDISALEASPQLGPALPVAEGVSPTAETLQTYATELYKIPWAVLVISFVVYFILGYLIYSSIYAAIGAAVDNETDTQQFILPIILPLVLAIYIGFFSVFNNPNGPIAVGFSLFPLTSPIVMLMRLPAGIGEGGVPLWEFITSILLLVITFIGIVWLAAKIYRVGILMYGKKPSYKELFKWLRY
ncbi:ABC transporter permease [Lentiprolixibacter aurantiacus]|uniref:ABC transporter permease n=1 Tax=Lentiprolixibacter aurantiacus TaxID=2993939 RepID=A0AAE3MNM0_9FLAO|nr:ABC transporter permease [Lentiprolixibacter aurantiacus]MCX2720518.1 ABC transporter permease [Lentiprolixibacter aurantiacus]